MSKRGLVEVNTDLIIERIRHYGALASVADQYSAEVRVPDEAKRLTILAEAEEVLDGLRDVIGANYIRKDINNATDFAHVQGEICR